jgi:vacuolar protein sorting-associated protein 45
MSGTVTKHLVVISELSLQIDKNELFQISELEQEIACRNDHSTQLQNVKKFIDDPKVSLHNALRLVLLYAMRYERHANCGTSGLLTQLKNRGGKSFMVPRILEYMSICARQELFNVVKLTDAVKLTRKLIKVSLLKAIVYKSYANLMDGKN